MNKKTTSILGTCASLVIGVAIGAFILWQFIQIKDKNREIATLQAELSRSQTDRFKDILRFGQWKLQVEKLAEKNGWVLPELSDTLTFEIEGASFEGHITAEKTGDSIRVLEKSVKINDRNPVNEAE